MEKVPAMPPAFVVKNVDWIRAALDSLRRKLAPPPVVILELITAYIIPRALYVVCKLGISDLLAGGPRSVQDLATTTKTHAQSLGRILRALASVGVYRQLGDGRYALTSLGKSLQQGAAGRMR